MRIAHSLSALIVFALFSSSSRSADVIAGLPSARSCFPSCSAYSGSPYCLAVGYDGNLSPKLSALRDRLAQRTQPIPAAWLRSNFNVPSDPCNRGDSRFADGAWRNSGLACEIRSRVEFAVGESVPIQLSVPAELSAFSEARGNFTILNIAGEAVMTSFGDAQWQKDWGGALEYVAFNDSIAMFQVPRGCISVDLKAK